MLAGSGTAPLPPVLKLCEEVTEECERAGSFPPMSAMSFETVNDESGCVSCP